MRSLAISILVCILFSRSVFSQVLLTDDAVKKADELKDSGAVLSAINLLMDTTCYKFDKSKTQFINEHLLVYYNILGKQLKDIGLYNSADSIYKKALTICDFIYDDAKESSKKTTTLNYCELLLRRGMYDSALEILDDGNFSENDEKLYLYYLLRKAEIYSYKGQFKESLALFNLIETFPLDTNIRYEATSNKAFLFMEMAFSEGSKNYYEIADSLFHSILTYNIDGHDSIIVMSNLASVEARLGKKDEAIAHINQALSWLCDNLNNNHQDVAITIRKKAEIELLLNGPQSALPFFKDYFNREKKYAIEQFAKMSEQQRIDYWKNKKPLISEIFALENEDPGFLYDVALFRRQVALLGGNDSLSVNKRLTCSRTGVAKSLGKREVAIEFVKYEKNNRNKYAALLLSGSMKDTVFFIPLWQEDSINMFDIGGKRLDSALCSKVAVDKNKVYQSEALSSFVWGKLLPYITEGSTVYFAPDGILHLLAIEYLMPVDDGKVELHRLTSTALLAEARRHSQRQNKKSLLIGGLDYDYIPPLIDDMVLSSSNHDAYNYLLQYGKTMLFAYLWGTKIEIDSISEHLKNTDKYEDVDESVLKKILGGYSKVHLATHGYSWNIEVPTFHYLFRDSISEDRILLSSGIALSGANNLYRYESREDGLLSARELCELDLNGVELVIMSSCQSAQGRVNDEGPTGLVRGLKKAGVETIVASLWPVDDSGTMLLMDFFYDEWREGLGKDGKGCTKTRALRLAQKRLRNLNGPRIERRVFNTSKKRSEYIHIETNYKAPYYWAPFIIIDDI